MNRIFYFLLISFLAGGATRAGASPLKLMSEIVAEEVNFKSAELVDVVRFLVLASREGDPDGIGVNILLRVSEESAQTTRITLDLRKVPLLQVLDLVTEHANLSYRVDRNIVFIEPKGYGPLETRFYVLDPSLFQQRMRALDTRR
jgi:hypothetical protein